jgi:Uma2 family endonuclease
LAADFPVEQYLATQWEIRVEWTKGYLIEMSAQTYVHSELIYYLRSLLKAYVSLRPLGKVLGEGTEMNLPDIPSYRLPDVYLVLNDNPAPIGRSTLHGPADICLEVVSEGNQGRDYEEKRAEYEAGGVKEYWIIDPLQSRATFLRRDDSGAYQEIMGGGEGIYTTPLLPGFKLNIATLWQTPLPDILQTVASVRDMLAAQ